MPLAPGTRLGPYEILASIGAGGMGEVYRARDTTLERDVAIKVLPTALAQDPERLARFKREAKVLASLNHPNIAQIYGVEDRALVMELVAGESPKGPLPLEAALNYARQIALALEAAHEKGIVHRDLKPTNVIVTPEGVVKVLDFGLAAVAQPSGCDSDPAASPTLTMPTQPGVIMGTAAYMSPEQAAGKPVDKRADIWSFGAVLWEFLAGRRLFEGETVSHTLADVLRGPIDFDKLPRETPPAIRGLLRRCLDRNVKDRLRDIGEARVAIDAVLSGATGGASEPAEPVPAWRRIVPWAVAGALAVALAITGWSWWRASQHVEQASVRVDVDLGPEISMRLPDESSNVIISPDGTRLVYVASASGGPFKLFTRTLDQPKAVELQGTEEAANPFFSPDGKWVGFVARGTLKKISIENGAVVPLGDVDATSRCSWGDDRKIILSTFSWGGTLKLIPANGGAAAPVTELADGETLHSLPHVLPGGKAVLFTLFTVGGSRSIDVVSLLDRRRKTLVQDAIFARYSATSSGTGYLVYSTDSTLFAIPFDLNRLETRGTAVPIVAPFESPDDLFDLSTTGTLVYRAGSLARYMTTIQWLDASGKRTPLPAKPGYYEHVRLSPDGGRLAVELADDHSPDEDIWIYEPRRDLMTRLTFGGRRFFSPVWSPDGRYVVFGCEGEGMFWARSDGAGQPQQFTQPKTNQGPHAFSPDGKRLVYGEFTSSGGPPRIQIRTVPIEEGESGLRAGKPEPFLQTKFLDHTGRLSPDGRWLAYQSNESGTNEVYVRPFPRPASGEGGKWQISTGGGTIPAWSRKNSELLYQSGDQIMAVSYTVKGDSFMPEKPRVWLSKLGGSTNWDLAPDGKHLAVVMPVDTPEGAKPDHEVTFIFNFLDELRRKVPVGK